MTFYGFANIYHPKIAAGVRRSRISGGGNKVVNPANGTPALSAAMTGGARLIGAAAISSAGSAVANKEGYACRKKLLAKSTFCCNQEEGVGGKVL